jgi:uncharacterized protein YlzI (FlbEa/FlbD family)
MDNIHLITIATHNEGYYNALKKSAEINNYELITLGWGQKWEGFIMKYKLLLENINKYDDNDIIILIDAYDVIVTGKKEEVINKFKKYNKPIVISRDGYTGDSIVNYIHNKLFESCNNIEICAGLMMGYVWALKELILLMCGNELNKCKELNIDDQILIINICKNNKTFFSQNVDIDKTSDIFFNTYGNVDNLQFDFNVTDIFNIKDNELYIKDTDISPCFIHGPANTNLNSVCIFYNLPIRKKSSRDMMYRIKLYTKPQYMSKFSDELNKIKIFFLYYFIMIFYLYYREYFI